MLYYTVCNRELKRSIMQCTDGVTIDVSVYFIGCFWCSILLDVCLLFVVWVFVDTLHIQMHLRPCSCMTIYPPFYNIARHGPCLSVLV